MAQVKMDLTELKALEAKEELLKESLKREKELNEKLENERAARIELLEKFENTVTVVHKKQTIETVIAGRNITLHEVLYAALREVKDKEPINVIIDPTIDRYRTDLTNIPKLFGRLKHLNISWLFDKGFLKIETHNIMSNDQDRYESRSISEIRSDIQREVEEAQSDKIKKKLSQADAALKEKNELEAEIRKLEKELKNTITEKNNHIDYLENTNKHCEEEKKTMVDHLVTLKQVKAIVLDPPLVGFNRKLKKILKDVEL